MTRKRVTASEKKQRHEWAIKQIDAGMGLSELTAFTAETWCVPGDRRVMSSLQPTRTGLTDLMAIRADLVVKQAHKKGGSCITRHVKFSSRANLRTQLSNPQNVENALA